MNQWAICLLRLSVLHRFVLIRHAIFFFFLLPLQIRNSFFHPFGRGRAFQEVIEEFLQAVRVVLLIDTLAQAVLLAVVAEHVNLFAQPSQREKVFDALIPRHRIVFVVIN